MQGIFSSNTPNVPAVSAVGTNGALGIQASSDTGTAIEATSQAHAAIIGGTVNGIGVVGNSVGDGGIGVRAVSGNGTAVNAQSGGGIAVLGSSDSNVGVLGESMGYDFGVVGQAANAGVAAFNPNNLNAAYLASDCCAAWFTGHVAVAGHLSKSGGGFRIDHPLEPADRFLAHSFVESSEMKNLYDGMVTLDANGQAVISLPRWFEALNSDIRYQLTPIGGPAPTLHVAEEIKEGRFTIAGGNRGTKVCWQVTGVRQDPWARANPITVEVYKPTKERGHFLHPELFGASSDTGIDRIRHPRRQEPMRHGTDRSS